MLQPMQGVRVLEVAQFTFVPAAGAVLADWGAEVIKVEHAERGDGQRGLTTVLGVDAIMKGSRFSPIFEGPNRGKRSVGLALEVPEARAVLDELIKRSDVFLTNFLPGARAKLHINVEDIRKVNPDIIYVRGSGFGARGPEATKGGYDMTAFWARGGSGAGATPAGAERLSPMPGLRVRRQHRRHDDRGGYRRRPLRTRHDRRDLRHRRVAARRGRLGHPVHR